MRAVSNNQFMLALLSWVDQSPQMRTLSSSFIQSASAYRSTGHFTCFAQVPVAGVS